MPWTAMHWVVLTLLLIIALLVITIVYLVDRRSVAEREGRYLPTVRQRRQWNRERLPIAIATERNRRRA